ncbi:unnamed protein product, partial [Owenia fusiformis]
LTRDAVAFLAEKNNITVATEETLDLIPGPTHLSQFKTAVTTSRVVVISVRGEVFRELMLYAYDMGLINGDYIFICINYYTQKRVYGDFSWQQGNHRDADLREALTAVFWFNYFEPPTSEYKSFQ